MRARLLEGRKYPQISPVSESKRIAKARAFLVALSLASFALALGTFTAPFVFGVAMKYMIASLVIGTGLTGLGAVFALLSSEKK